MFNFKNYKIKTTTLSALILALCILLSSLCGCGNYGFIDGEEIYQNNVIEEETVAETVQEDDRMTIHETVEIYFNNEDVWHPELEYKPMYGRTISFMDLNFDGVLEVIVTSTDGTMRNSVSHYYTINEENNTVVEVGYDSDNNEYGNASPDFGYSKIDEIKLYKKSNGDMRYWAYDYTFAGSLERSCITSEFALVDGEIIDEPIFDEYVSVDDFSEDANETKVYYLYENNESVKISEDKYNDFIDDYEAKNENLNLNMIYIYDYDYNSADDDTRYNMLLDSYKAFSYDGYTAPELGENRKEAQAEENAASVTEDDIEKSMIDYEGYTVDDVAEIWGSDYKLGTGMYRGGWKGVIFNNDKCPFIFYLSDIELDATTCDGSDVICAVHYLKNSNVDENFYVTDGVSVDMTMDEVVGTFGGEPYENQLDGGMAYSTEINGVSVMYYWFNDTNTVADEIIAAFS